MLVLTIQVAVVRTSSSTTVVSVVDAHTGSEVASHVLPFVTDQVSQPHPVPPSPLCIIPSCEVMWNLGLRVHPLTLFAAHTK